MKIMTEHPTILKRGASVLLGLGLVAVCASAQESEETQTRIRIAAANMEDAVVVDCQLPGKLRRLGGTRTYLTPGRLIRTSAIVCRTRGGEYTLGDLASGTLSLQRWMVPAKEGDAEAQYYVARIYANGMDNVEINYAEAAAWYQKAADQGYAEAKQELGYLYELGLGVEKDELKALNLQRDASGLGDDLDYAYKIADAEALADDLAKQLLAANGALQDSQLELRATQDRLTAARAAIREQEVALVGLVADLEQSRRLVANASSAKVEQLEAEIAQVTAQLADSQATILGLERERDSSQAALSAQLAGGQASQQELRELLARTERAEGESESLAAQLAEAQQRLIQSDEEMRRLQASYREQSEDLTSARALLLEASARTETDAQAYIAAREAEVASKAARIASLESQVRSLQGQLYASGNTSAEDALRREIDSLQARYDNDMAALQSDRDRLSQTYAASEAERNALYAASRQQLITRDAALEAQKRQLDTLSAESAQLRARVNELETRNSDTARQSNLESAQLQAQLSMSRQQVTTLRSALDDAQAQKSALEAKLLADRMALQEQLAAEGSANEQAVALLRAEVSAAESTINLQNLRIAALEQQAADGAAQLAGLKNEVREPAQIAPAMSNAMAILSMAQSAEDPNLGNYHALLIANEDYINMDRLTTPVRDANEIERLLTDRYGFSVRKLTNATDDEIMRTLHDYANELTSDDNLLIYYAGRGSTPDGPPDRAYWLGVDADPELRNTWLLAEHVSEKIKEIQAQRILLVTDSCFSRRRIQSQTMSVGRGMDPERFKLLTQFKSRYVLTSGANVPFYDENGDRTHSMFAKLFIEVLRQNNNVLSGEMLSYELSSRLRERVADPERVTPTYSFLQDAGHKAGDFFFVPKTQGLLAASVAMGQDTA
jgi:hypothetical protein